MNPNNLYPTDVQSLYEQREFYYEEHLEERKKFSVRKASYLWLRAEEIDRTILDYEERYGIDYVDHIPMGVPLPWKKTNMADETKQKLKAREVTVPELSEILHCVLKTNIVPFVWGPPGVGKSSIVKQIAKEKGWEIIDLRLSLLNPVDLRGLPTVDHKEKKADWLPPSFLPTEDTQTEGMLFLDEINLAPLSVQAAAYQLILDKRVGEYRFPKTWKIVAAGNREVDKANVFKISAPLANRFVHYTVRPDFYSWKPWAEQSGIHPTLIQFLSLRPVAIFDPPTEAEKAFPSPRSWQFVSEMLDAFDYDETNDVPDHLIQTIMGAVGEGVGREVIEFFNSFKMQEMTRKIETFIKTGNITMPRSTSQRLTLIGSVFEAYAEGKLDQVKYDAWQAKLTGEERATIKEFEEKNADKLAKKYKNPNRMPQGGKETKLLLPFNSETDGSMYLESSDGFEPTGTVLVVSPDGKKQLIAGYAALEQKDNSLRGLTSNGLGAVFQLGSTVSRLA